MGILLLPGVIVLQLAGSELCIARSLKIGGLLTGVTRC